MKRTIKKQFWFTREEAQNLQKKAKKACVSETSLVRILLAGYEPKEQPDDRFYHAMNRISDMGNQVEQLGLQLKILGNDCSDMVIKEAERWHKFQAEIEREFLRPQADDQTWQ